MADKRNDIVFLVGYRATGKTTVGVELAKILGWGFVDLDKEIEKRTSKSIKEIFSEYGEDVFRKFESEVLEDVYSKMTKVVVSTGGGCVIREENRKILKKGIVILLRSGINTIVARMLKDSNRPPLTKGMKLEEEVIYTLTTREKFYEEVWDISVFNENVLPLILAKLIRNCISS